MNNQLIEKIITSNNIPCPELTFDNPLLDKEVASKLSKSFVQILNLSQENTKVNNNLRISILENIRKMCRMELNSHMNLDDNATALLRDVYEQKMKDISSTREDSSDKDLDAFLIRSMKDLSIKSTHEPKMNPEIMQALYNMKENRKCLDFVLKDIIHWSPSDKKSKIILKGYWGCEEYVNNDIHIKLKSEIERILLEICNDILIDRHLRINEIFDENKGLIHLVKKSAGAATCFQICTAVLHYVFVMTNYSDRIQAFIRVFVEQVKLNTAFLSISVLYPPHVSSVILLLDMDVELLPRPDRDDYIDATVKYLTEIKGKSRVNDLIMLLSHFPQWFNIYFEHKTIKESN